MIASTYRKEKAPTAILRVATCDMVAIQGNRRVLCGFFFLVWDNINLIGWKYTQSIP